MACLGKLFNSAVFAALRAASTSALYGSVNESGVAFCSSFVLNVGFGPGRVFKATSWGFPRLS